MHRRILSVRKGSMVVLAVCTVCGMASMGCYKKITRAEGFGADRITTEQSDLDTPLNNAIFGKPPSARNTNMPGPGSP